MHLSLSFLAMGALGSAATFTANTITFNEYPFPTTTTVVSNSTLFYNVINDATAAPLLSNNGDLNDLALTHTQSGVGNVSVDWNSTSTGRFTSNRAFNGSPTGALAWTSSVLLFGSHLSIIDLQASFQSLNTRGVAWEYSTVGFLDENGNPFSLIPNIGTYSSYSGISGSPSARWFVAASTGTITGVRTATAAAGSSGPNDNLVFTYALAGQAPGTRVGGIYWSTFLEDVRGVNNGSTSFTASSADITISGSTVTSSVPEASSLVSGISGLALGVWHLRRS